MGSSSSTSLGEATLGSFDQERGMHSPTRAAASAMVSRLQPRSADSVLRALKIVNGPGRCSLDPFSWPYSPKCSEGVFCELRHNGVLRSSALLWCSGAHTRSPGRRMLRL